MPFDVISTPSGEHPTRDAFRQSLRGFASTVTIITTEDAGELFGMVATAVMSISLDPPMLAIAINRSASSYNALTRRKAFCVNALGTSHEATSRQFSRPLMSDRFQDGDWVTYAGAHAAFENIPYLTRAQAAIFCETHEIVHYGSHAVFLGAVKEAWTQTAADPLVYCSGQYGRFSVDVA